MPKKGGAEVEIFEKEGKLSSKRKDESLRVTRSSQPPCPKSDEPRADIVLLSRQEKILPKEKERDGTHRGYETGSSVGTDCSKVA